MKLPASFFHQWPSNFVLFNREGQILAANHRLCHLLGYTTTEIQERILSEIIHTCSGQEESEVDSPFVFQDSGDTFKLERFTWKNFLQFSRYQTNKSLFLGQIWQYSLLHPAKHQAQYKSL